jgi:hypothetical protein
MTLDQLQYIIERKYNNIIFGSDVIIACTLSRSEDGRRLINNQDAFIVEWNINYIEKPSEKELDVLWCKLSEQYHSDPARVDSDMFKHINNIDSKVLDVTINDI